MLPLIIAPNSILKQAAANVAMPPSNEILILAQKMLKAMVYYKGIGLAAPQVGQSLRLIIITTKTGPVVCINPQIIKSSWRKIDMEEGCLSIPNVFGIVRRPKSITASYTTLNGTQIVERMDEMTARIYQHEIDHINGILFIDRNPKIIAGLELLNNYNSIKK